MRKIIVFFILSFLAFPAFADGYFGIGYGRTKANVDKNPFENGLGAFEGVPFGTPLGAGETWSSGTNDSDTGYRLFVGYQVNEYFAVEGSYVNLGKFLANASLNIPGIGTDTLSGTAKATGFDLGLVGFIPINEQFSFLGRAGIFLWNADTTVTLTNFAGFSVSDNQSASGNSLSYGLGAQYNFNKSVGLRGEFQRFTDVGDKNKTGQTDVDLISLGLIFKI